MYWVKYHINYLRMWRKAAKSIADSIRDLEINAKAYVIGGAAENRLTVLSDIDILVCLEKHMRPEELYELRKKILTRAIDHHSLPWDYPVELHIHNMTECREILKQCKKYIKIL